MHKIPSKYAPLLFALILSGLMSFLVSGISTFRVAGSLPDFASLWLGAWLTAWLFAFPAVLVIAPVTRRVVGRLVTME